MRLRLLLILALAIIQISEAEPIKEDESEIEQKSEGNIMTSSEEDGTEHLIGLPGEQSKEKKGNNINTKKRRRQKKKKNTNRQRKHKINKLKTKRKGGKREKKKNPNTKRKKKNKGGSKKRRLQNTGGISVGIGRQSCDETALCQKIKDYIKYSNQLRKVKRIMNTCEKMEKKANKSATEFDATVAALDKVIGSNAKRRLYTMWRRTQRSTDEITAIRDNLKNCSVSVKAMCEKKVEPACLETALHSECEAALQGWLTQFGPSKGSCLQASSDCCSCITALPTLDAKCLDFDAKSTSALSSKKKCTGGMETGSFGFCRKLQQEASVKGPPAACGFSTATRPPSSTTTAAAGNTTSANQALAKLQERISIMESKVQELTLGSVPIGTIIAWTPVASPTSPVIQVPDGWLECDGRSINKGPWKGYETPNINEANLFLRGVQLEKSSEVLTTQEDMVKTLSYEDYFYHVSGCLPGWKEFGPTGAGTCHDCDSDTYCTKTSTVTGSGGSETRPKNMKVVYIIRIQ